MTEDEAQGVASREYKQVFGTPEGKRVLADLMTVTGVYDLCTETDPIRLAQITGARNVALHIAARLNFKPGEFADRADHDEFLMRAMFGER